MTLSEFVDELAAQVRRLTIAVLILATMVIVGAPTVAVLALNAKSDARRATAALATGNRVLALLGSDALAECQRVQTVRAEVNRNSQIIHDVLTQSAVHMLRAAVHPTGRIATHATRRQRQADRANGWLYLRYANSERYHPPTNCAVAAVEGTRYKRPVDRPFR